MSLPAQLLADTTARASTRVADLLAAAMTCRLREPHWRVVAGLLRVAMRTFDAVYHLVPERGAAFPVEAGLLIRSLLENLGVLLALTEAPEERLGLYARDSYRRGYARHCWLRQRHQADPSWAQLIADFEAGLRTEAETIGLSGAELERPERLPEWPTPGGLAGKSRKRFAFKLEGERASVFAEIYDAWYANLSGVAHQSLAGIEMSLNRSERPGARRAVLGSAGFFLACVLTEIEGLAHLEGTPSLRELWSYVCGLSPEMARVHEMRYRRLLASAAQAEPGAQAG